MSSHNASPYLLIFWGILCLLGLVAITGDTLWFDESTTVYLASQPSWERLWTTINEISFSESQMPGYISYMWGWTQLLGDSEWTLRLANWPLWVLLLTSFYFLPVSDRVKWIALGMIGLSPFLWYNMNEARSTILLGSLAGMALSGVVYVFEGKTLGIRRWGLAVTTMSVGLGIACHMLFLLYMPALGLLCILLARKNRLGLVPVLRQWAIPLGLLAVIGGVMLMYYLGTLERGAGGIYKTPGAGNIAFSFYEFLGFQGMGPARSDLKQLSGLSDVIGFLPWLAALGLTWAGVAFLTVKRLMAAEGRQNMYFWAFVGGLGVFLGIAVIKDFWFWGRHMIFLYPMLVLALATWIDQSWESLPRLTRGLVIAGMVLWTCSAIRLRVLDTYSKRDNYQLAALKSQEMNQEGWPVFWTGNWMGGAYYGLDFKLGADYLHETAPPRWEVSQAAGRVPSFEHDLMRELFEQYEKGYLIWFDFYNDRDKDGALQDYLSTRPTEVVFEEKTFKLVRILPKEIELSERTQ